MSEESQQNVSSKAKKSAAKKTLNDQVVKATPKDAVFVCLDASCPRFDLVLDVDETIRGFRNSEGHLVFTVPAELAERARKHFHVTNGRLVES